MEDLKMVLKNGQEIAIVGFALPLSITVNCKSIQGMTEIWEQLHNQEAMQKVEIIRDGLAGGTYFGVVVDGAQIVDNGDDTLTVHFYLHDSGERAVDEYVQAAKILLGEEM